MEFDCTTYGGGLKAKEEEKITRSNSRERQSVKK